MFWLLELMLLVLLTLLWQGYHGSFTFILTVFCSTGLFLFMYSSAYIYYLLFIYCLHLLLSMGMSNTSIQNKPTEHMVEITCA